MSSRKVKRWNEEVIYPNEDMRPDPIYLCPGNCLGVLDMSYGRTQELVVDRRTFDKAVRGYITEIRHEIRPEYSERFVRYVDKMTENEYGKYTELPEPAREFGAFWLEPDFYDSLRLVTEANGDMPAEQALFYIKDIRIVVLLDEFDNDIVYEYEGHEYSTAEIVYLIEGPCLGPETI